MLQQKHQRIQDLFLVFSLLLGSNVTAFRFVFWLNRDNVFVECVAWFILAVCSYWFLKKYNLINVFVENLKRNWTVFPFLVISGFSIIWSIDEEISLYRWLILVFTIVAGGYIGLRFDLKRFIDVLSIFGIVILFASLIFIIYAPSVGVMNYYCIQGAWRGLYWHKNHFGIISTFFNILFLINVISTWRFKNKRLVFWGASYLFSLFCVCQSDSAAAMMVTIFLHCLVFSALFFLKFGKYIRRHHYVILSIVLCSSLLVLLFNLDHFFALFNRNSTLTGRIPMWHHLFDTYLSWQPFFGYGFNAFWYNFKYQVEIGIAAHYPDPIIIADNGFIDILMNTGTIGLSLFLIFYCSLWWRTIQFAVKAKDIVGVFPVILMTYTLLANVSWSLIFENESFCMLIMLYVQFFISSRTSSKRVRFPNTPDTLR